MKIIKFKKFFTALIIFCMSFPIYISSINNGNYNYFTTITTDDNFLNNENSETVKVSSISYGQNEVTGTVNDRDGKIFSNISMIIQGAYINRYQPDLSKQPALYIPDWNITYAKMYFDNITAVNYTYNLETNPSEFFGSPSPQYPFYLFQKFSVELDQYVNNVSIFIQDIANMNEFNNNNSWEIAIFNCSNDEYGTPNVSLGALLKPHPLTFAAHWEIFDFKNSETGPVFINTSKTKSTFENGAFKFWFALRIRIPPDDSHIGGGPKFLYFNPMEINSLNTGISNTFATFQNNPVNANFTETYVVNYTLINGTMISGTLQSFNLLDNDRYLANSSTNNLTIQTKIEIGNLTNWEFDEWGNKPLTFNETYEIIKNNLTDIWTPYHLFFIYGFNIYLATNMSDIKNFNIATLYLRNYSSNEWINISDTFELKNDNENLQLIEIRDANTKADVISCMNFTNDKNELDFKFEYNSSGKKFNISINQFRVDVLYLYRLPLTVPYDPMIQELYYPNNVVVVNGTVVGDNSTTLLKLNDNKYFRAESKTNNLTLEFEFNFAPYLNSSYWEVTQYDWDLLYPNPVISQIDLKLSSNVSITSINNLTRAALEVYKGSKTFLGLSPQQNKEEWFLISPMKLLAHKDEYRIDFPYNSTLSWLLLQFANASENNLIKFRFRYVWDESKYPLEGTFNVTIDEFAFNLHLSNARRSEIASTIGFGLNSGKLNVSHIQMKINGYNINYVSNQKGSWEGHIIDGVPFQGYYKFNSTSLWPEIIFDVNGTCEIEQYYPVQWEFELGNDDNRITWYVGADINYYEYENYTIIESSRGLQVLVPSDWLYMNTYNYTTSTLGIGGGGWSWINETIGTLKRISVFNISDGKWKVKMNSSIYSMDISYSDTKDVKIDNNILVDALIPNHYGGTISFEVHDSDDHLVYEDSVNLNKTARENSTSFSWDIFATTQASDTYSLTTYWMDYNQTHAFASLETIGFEVSKYATVLSLMDIETFKNESIMGTKILISGNLTKKNPGEPIEGETVIFEISSEGGIIDNLTDITNEEGIVQVEYTLPDGYKWIQIKLLYNSTGTFYEETESTKMIKITLISQLQYNLNIFLLFLPYILAVAGGISAFVVYRQLRLRKLREIWAGDSLVLDDLLKISYIMIIHKDAGVTIYNNQISMELDSDLIGGFLTAISQFRSEIKKGENQPVEGKKIVEGKESVESKDLSVGKGFEMDYYDFKIVITDGAYVRVALILDGTPSEKLKERQWAFTNEFEDKFRPVITKFTGDIKPFKETDKLVEKYFNISLMYPLQVGKHWEVIQLNTLEKALMEVAEQVQKEKKFFFVSTLLSFGLAGRKQSRDQIISTILSLKRKGLLVPLETK